MASGEAQSRVLRDLTPALAALRRSSSRKFHVQVGQLSAQVHLFLSARTPGGLPLQSPSILQANSEVSEQVVGEASWQTPANEALIDSQSGMNTDLGTPKVTTLLLRLAQARDVGRVDDARIRLG